MGEVFDLDEFRRRKLENSPSGEIEVFDFTITPSTPIPTSAPIMLGGSVNGTFTTTFSPPSIPGINGSAG